MIDYITFRTADALKEWANEHLETTAIKSIFRDVTDGKWYLFYVNSNA